MYRLLHDELLYKAKCTRTFVAILIHVRRLAVTPYYRISASGGMGRGVTRTSRQGIRMLALSRQVSRMALAYGLTTCTTLTHATAPLGTCNQPPSTLNPMISISVEVSEGHIIGPLSPQWRAMVHISQFGVIPKPHQPGKWHLIFHLCQGLE